MVSPGFFCLLICSVLVFTVVYYGAFCLYVATIFFSIPVFYPKLELYLVLLQSLCLFYNLSNCILLFFSYISSAAVILLASVALMVQFSLPFSRAGGAS